MSINLNRIDQTTAPSVILPSTASINSPALFSRDLVIQEDRLSSTQMIPPRASPKIPKSQPPSYMIIAIAQSAEELKTLLLQSQLEAYQDQGKQMIEDQKRFQELLKQERKHHEDLAYFGYIERLFSGFASTLSIAVGAAMASTLVPHLVYGGAVFMVSGSLSLTALGLEAFGVDSQYTKPIHLSGLAIGALASILGGYLYPGAVQSQLQATFQYSTVALTSLTKALSSNLERKQFELDAQTAEEKKIQEIHKIQYEQLANELMQIIKRLDVAEKASEMIRQLEAIKYQFIHLQVTQG